MEQNQEKSGETSTVDNASIDLENAKASYAQRKAQQNLPLGIVGGIVAAIIGAVVWAVVTVATEYQIGWMAVGVGFLVGYAVRFFGKGVSSIFGVVGSVCALLGCILGNILSTCGFMSVQESVPLFQVITKVLPQPSIILDLLKFTFNPMDLLFYGIALYEGYKFSFQEIAPEKLS